MHALSTSFCILLALSLAAAEAKPKIEKPNIIVILADDLGYGDLGCYGAKDIRTPQLDQLAAEGTKFTDFYVPAAQCSPTRAAFLSGSYPQRIHCHRLFGKDNKGFSLDEITIAELLKAQGYRTGCIGKWHLENRPDFHPNRHGFDHFYGFLNPSYDNKDARIIHRNDKVVATGPESKEISDDLTDEAIHFIRKNQKQPFFLYLAHDMPHVPLELPQERKGKSKGGPYGDVIEHLDDCIGQVMTTLKDLKLGGKTLVIFTSDNGPALHWSLETGSAKPLRGSKHTTCEGGYRVPCIVWGPGIIPANRECSELISIMDFLPTFAELTGGKTPTDRAIDGKNIWPILQGEKESKSPHQAFYYYKRHNHSGDVRGNIECVRVGDWKLRVPMDSYHQRAKARKGDFKLAQLKLPEDGELPSWDVRRKNAIANLKVLQLDAAIEKVGLYNLKDDIGESVNLADMHPGKVKELRALMTAFDRELKKNNRPCGVAK